MGKCVNGIIAPLRASDAARAQRTAWRETADVQCSIRSPARSCSRSTPRPRTHSALRGSRCRGAFRHRAGVGAAAARLAGHRDGHHVSESRRSRRRSRQERRAPARPRHARLRLPRSRHRDAARAAGQSEAAHVSAAEAQALINRLGFNNDGVAALVANVARARYAGVLGINIGKNFDTPNERAVDDYVTCLRAVYPHAHLRHRQHFIAQHAGLARPAGGRRAERAARARSSASKPRCATRHGRYVPLAVKIAPDLDRRRAARHRAAARCACASTA